LISLSFSAADDRELLWAMIDQSVIGYTMDLNTAKPSGLRIRL
jgi:hypothetical protein